VLQGAPDLLDVSLAAAVVNAEIHNDLLVRVEKLLVKLRNNLHNVAGLKAQALAAGNKLIEIPARVHDPLLLIRHEVIQLLAQRPKLHGILFREFGVLPVVVIVLDYLGETFIVISEAVFLVQLCELELIQRPLIEDSIGPEYLLEVNNLLVLQPVLLNLLVCEQELSHIDLQFVTHSETILVFG
jgi:hypothetical protein